MSNKKGLEVSNYIFEEYVPYFQTMRISGECPQLIFELNFSNAADIAVIWSMSVSHFGGLVRKEGQKKKKYFLSTNIDM